MLKPCWRCGSEDVETDQYSPDMNYPEFAINCDGCGAIHIAGHVETYAELLDYWNTRPE